MLQSADELFAAAVATTLSALALTEADTAAVRLARRYATAIDNGGDLADLGPKLLACLTALGATPAARARIKTARQPDAQPGRLAQLRAARGA
jgi:hypothetical protein